MLNDDRQLKDSTLSVIDASGRQISLLNDNGQLAGSEPGSPHSENSCDEPTLIFNTQHTAATTTWMPPVVHSTITTDQHQQYQQLQQHQQLNHSSSGSKRKYHCSEPGCNKSFTTRQVGPTPPYFCEKQTKKLTEVVCVTNAFFSLFH
ncbi:hypothetical protein [Absidia glauca]|uniref:Uncharacterized protein n=1 Tax=Absidia glauca TaxID=4829 RepID=A0A168Q0X8_ABSGL|nr:hypothetical protein [Absidia glauca]